MRALFGEKTRESERMQMVIREADDRTEFSVGRWS